MLSPTWKLWSKGRSGSTSCRSDPAWWTRSRTLLRRSLCRQESRKSCQQKNSLPSKSLSSPPLSARSSPSARPAPRPSCSALSPVTGSGLGSRVHPVGVCITSQLDFRPPAPPLALEAIAVEELLVVTTSIWLLFCLPPLMDPDWLESAVEAARPRRPPPRHFRSV